MNGGMDVGMDSGGTDGAADGSTDGMMDGTADGSSDGSSDAGGTDSDGAPEPPKEPTKDELVQDLTSTETLSQALGGIVNPALPTMNGDLEVTNYTHGANTITLSLTPASAPEEAVTDCGMRSGGQVAHLGSYYTVYQHSSGTAWLTTGALCMAVEVSAGGVLDAAASLSLAVSLGMSAL
jgi:hypothetical protein